MLISSLNQYQSEKKSFSLCKYPYYSKTQNVTNFHRGTLKRAKCTFKSTQTDTIMTFKKDPWFINNGCLSYTQIYTHDNLSFTL